MNRMERSQSEEASCLMENQIKVARDRNTVDSQIEEEIQLK